MTWCSQGKGLNLRDISQGTAGFEIQGHLSWGTKLLHIETNSMYSVLKYKMKVAVSAYVAFKHWTHNITYERIKKYPSFICPSQWSGWVSDMKYGVLIKEFIAKPGQPLALTYHNLQNIFVSLMKASIYISHSVLLGKSLALGRFTFTELMKFYFSLCNISVGRREAFWSNFLSIRKLLAAFTNICKSSYPRTSKPPDPYQVNVSACWFIFIYLLVASSKWL